MDLEEPVREFARLPGADLLNKAIYSRGSGPWEVEVAEFVRRFPHLSRYPDYLRFLTRFGGAGLYFDPPQSDRYVHLTIWGFEQYGEPLEADEGGLLGFAELQARYQPHVPGTNAFEGCVWRVFALDASGKRRPEVFAPIWPAPDPAVTSCVPHWATFSAWLTEVVACRGKLPL
jgi:hypothetical protein